MLIIYCIVTLFVVYFLFDKLTSSYLNPYKLIMVIGKKGSGKTTYLTKVAIRSLSKGQTVYSTIDIPGTIVFDVNDIGNYTFVPNSVVLIDEVGLVWDNRDFKNFKPQCRNFFKYQRQYKLKVYLFSQTFDVDKKLRDLTDEMYLLRNVMRVWSVSRRIQKRLTIQQGTGEGNVSTLADDYEFVPLLSGHAFEVTFIPRWVSYFKSYNPPYLPMIKGKWLEMTDVQEYIMLDRHFYLYKFYSFLNLIKDKIRNFRIFRR